MASTKAYIGLALLCLLLEQALADDTSVPEGCKRITEFECIESTDSCQAVEVCKEPQLERCGKDICSFPYVCKTSRNSICRTFAQEQKRCQEKKVCKEVRKKCGYGGLTCGFDEDCVMEKICNERIRFFRDSLVNQIVSDVAINVLSDIEERLGMVESQFSSVDGLNSNDLNAFLDGPGGNPLLEVLTDVTDPEQSGCHWTIDNFYCAKKEPCFEIIEPACVPERLLEDSEYSGLLFSWIEGWKEGDKCGDKSCLGGYRCADVVKQDCDIYAGIQCGDELCAPGSVCVEEEDCGNLPYISTVCQGRGPPVCVPLSKKFLPVLEPPCETEFQCQREESVCGSQICPAGTTCSILSKDVCLEEDP